jgi:protein-S-isoprenylcysteine O-methyltransferase Ste14
MSPDQPGLTVRVGGWLFRQRSWLPVPIVLALILIPAPAPRALLVMWLGAAIVAAGESLRLWGVHHIGVISRTRSERLGPLIDSGPFAYVRNPLYLGNLAIWAGFAVSAGLVWLLPAVILLLGLEYHAIVRWEETLLATRLGTPYTDYLRRVPRWVPRATPTRPTSPPHERSAGAGHSWSATLFSERGTLIALAAGYALLWLKSRM